MVRNSFSDLVRWEFDLGEEPIGDANEGISRPGMEPIDGRAVDESGELSGTESEGITDG